MRWEGDGARILDFDIECRPITYLGGDYTTAQVTAIGCAWVGGKGKVASVALGHVTNLEMAEWFLDKYHEADMVTGHYIRGFDLPVINGMLMRLRLPLLPDKLSHDTKLDSIKSKYVSKSQESIGAMLSLAAPKVKMNQQMWYEANTLDEEGIKLTRERVEGDVRQHMEMRQRMIELGWLTRPRMWRSIGHLSGVYQP